MSETNPAAEPAHRRRTLSFVRRSNNLKPSYQRAWDAALGKELLDVPHGERDTSVAEGFTLDWDTVFGPELGAEAPLIVEIGSGSGEAVAAAAAAHPDTRYVAIEVYRPGAAQLAARLRREGLSNVRVACLDAVEVLDKLVPPAGLDELWVFFPDPWHKKKHNKRRLVQPGFVDRAARALRPGGTWRLATDWSNYAEQMREVITASEAFQNPHRGERSGQESELTAVKLDDLDARSLGKEAHPLPLEEALDTEGGWAPRFTGRVQTDFEAKALEAGRRIFDLTFTRR